MYDFRPLGFGELLREPGWAVRGPVRPRVGSSARRAFGGCLGSKRRGRTRYPAISLGEPGMGFDPRISEWGNPPVYFVAVLSREGAISSEVHQVSWD